MKILLVDAYPRTKEGRKAFNLFRALVEQKVKATVECECELIISHYTKLEEYVYAKKEMSGLDDAVRHAAREVFDEADMDGNGSLDEYEMLRMLTQLFQKMGMPVKTDQLPRLKQEVRIAVLRYDTDCNGTLEFDEVAEMLCVDPWRELLPSDSRQKENARIAMKNFCLLDMIIVDGDPQLMPWLPESENLLQLISQVVYSNKAGLSHFVGGTGCTLFGTAVATQVVQYLSHVGQRQLPVFNGLYDGKMGSSMRGTQRALHSIHVHDECVSPPPDSFGVIGQGGMFLDNSTGIVYEYDPNGAGRTNVIENAAMANAPGAWHCVSCNWKRVTDVGIVCNGSRTSGLRNQYRPAPVTGPVMEDSCITRANLESAQFKHWMFDGIGGTSIVGPCSRNWDINIKSGTGIVPLARGKRGPEILEMHGKLLTVQFGVHKDYPDTVTLLDNFIQRRISEFTQAAETKHAYYEWMLAAASDGKLHLEYLPAHLAEYGAKAKEDAAKAAEDAKDQMNLKKDTAMDTGPGYQFTDEEMEGGAKTMSIKQLATWNESRADPSADRAQSANLSGEIGKINEMVEKGRAVRGNSSRRSMFKGCISQALSGGARLPALRWMTEASTRQLPPTKYELPKQTFEMRRQTPPPGLPGSPPTLDRDRPRRMTPGPDTVRDFVMSIGHGGFEHPPYITTDYIEEPKRLQQELNMSRPRQAIATPWHSALDTHGFGVRPEAAIEYDRRLTKIYNHKDNAIHFDKKMRHDHMLRTDKSSWIRRSSVSGQPVGFRSSFASTQMKWAKSPSGRGVVPNRGMHTPGGLVRSLSTPPIQLRTM